MVPSRVDDAGDAALVDLHGDAVQDVASAVAGHHVLDLEGGSAGGHGLS
jgi:hypothetical protein